LTVDGTGASVRFDGQVAVVTGSGRGLGREFAGLLAARGAAVVVNDVRPDDGSGDSAAAVAAAIIAAGGRAVASTADISVPAEAAGLVATAVEAFGAVDIVINNAGNRRFKPFPDLDDEDLLALFSVHVRGAWHVTRAAWRLFETRKGGRVLNVASVDGTVIGIPDHAAYGTCKAAMVGMTHELAVEGAPSGIRVNALLPGAATPDGMGAVEGKNYAPPIEVGTAVVAPGACWLVHPGCDVSGQVFSCSSGRMARVYTCAAEGWQAHPDGFTLEAVRDHWADIVSPAGAREITTVDDWNAFRTEIYRRGLAEWAR
jgi:NAD(P)-dependent dehydrogenase (short-subunit alcohol dehydrogenase family)